MKNRDYPLSPTPYPTEDIKSKKLEAKPIPSQDMKRNNVVLSPSKTKEADRAAYDKKVNRKKSIKDLETFGARVAGGAATLIGGYYALTKKAGGKEQRDYSGRVTGKTPEKRIWKWEKE